MRQHNQTRSAIHSLKCAVCGYEKTKLLSLRPAAPPADGRRTYRFFEPEMDARVKARRTLELDIRQAIADGAFELHYQPVVHLGSNEIAGCEALLR